ncbi:type II CRISPR RNA-guided endonuclease Cas9 [Draconibacterium halophilum]|uniref:CRISPR-associated endonuclease Cas9 n=1 Tax=Draconibacterium halophilum TaxID=2706887 RepID=A0A6C0RBZ8_9BACT|nr:type II CRISPR RNA-guided endonuclease Cas9 [Draconibacterium halophilum]QIA07850.1 type II CRISPR RNA-guided endonuclease Cas9 [Draconibacterium halophilum]
MAKILGLDLGTNSVGWAVVEKQDGEFSLLDKGVRIFQEGVKIEKGIESSKAAERTEHRSARRLKYRRKLRKIETLKALSEYGYCPHLASEELDLWRYKKIYPKNISFRNWWHTDEDSEKHPYFFRKLAITRQLDLNKEENKYKLGRAFYHLAQRRGFFSNRLDSTPENETGKVKSSIKELQEKKGDRTLGQYFYDDCYLKGEKIRDQYTSREDDYLDEFKRICAFQNIPEELQQKLHKAIFYQRPLKSQKGLIGKCVFEPTKARCAVSRPEFEEYRMLCFINNIKIKTPDDEKLRILNAEERSKIVPRFFLQREHFDFEDLAKQLAPKKQYKYYRDRNKNPEDYLLNYSMKTTVSGCPVSARFKDLFGGEFIDEDFNYIKGGNNRTPKFVSDAWHVLYTFDSDKKLKEYAQKHFDFSEDKMTLFSQKIHLKQDFASLSLKAINKILPYLREGLIYSHAVFLANMEETVPAHVWKNEENRKIIRTTIKEIIENHSDNTTIVNMVNGFITNARRENEVWSEEAKHLYFNDLDRKIKTVFGAKRFETFSEYKKNNLINTTQRLIAEYMPKNLGKGEHVKAERLDEAVLTFLGDNFGEENLNAKKLYHPSAIETYKPAKRGKDGRLYLGSPMTSSVRNPMAMRALHQLRLVINELIKAGTIDSNTKINIEMSRGLLNANERTGLRRWQDDREKKRKEYIERIKEHFSPDYQPSVDEVLKYQLWEEQRRICLYTGKPINIEDFLGSDPRFDIEHTIPRSQSYDNSQENKTLCENEFNRKTKRNRIPSELPNSAEILVRIEHWKEEIEKLEKEIQKAVRQSKGAGDKDQKDKAIQKRHQLSYERNYWKNKYKRFTMEEVPEGFKNSQMVDIGIITKYSRLYMKTVFPKVYTVKGNTVADFRKMWGLQDIYTKKARVNHVHHCIDAITIACMDKSNYETLAKFYHDSEDAFERGHEAKPEVEKPWLTFAEDVKDIEKEVLVSHHTPDVLPKQSKKKLRKRGKIQYNKNGDPIYLKGDTVRGSLHKDTLYGAIKREETNKKGEIEEKIKYVVRKPLDMVEDSNIKNIVDERIREIVANARKEEKNLKKEIEALKKKLQKAEEREEAGLKQDIATIEEQIRLLYSLPNKNGTPVPIKKVRLLQPSVTNPLRIKKQRDKSQKNPKPWKEDYFATNDGNYMMAIYEGKDKKGKLKRDFEIVNNMQAGEFFKYSVQNILKAQELGEADSLFPQKKIAGKIDLPFKAIIKVGTMVMLWENTPDEVWDISAEEIKRRMYKVVGLSQQIIQGKYFFATIIMRFHQEAQPTTELKVKDGAFEMNENFKPYRKMNHNQFNALIEGVDFELTPLGKIKRLK